MIDRPMCMRTHRYLGEPALTDEGVFRCPGNAEACAGGETYELQSESGQAFAAMTAALAFGLRTFGQTPTRRVVIWLVRDQTGQRMIPPEMTVDQAGDFAVYLTGSTADQLAFQAAHEVAHVLLTPVATHHWIHELVAVLFSLEFTERGYPAYAARQKVALETEATDLELGAFLEVTELPYPPGTYGRAWVFGSELLQIVGPAGYHALGRSFTDGQPDFFSWVDTLPSKQQAAVGDLVAGVPGHVLQSTVGGGD